MGRVSLVLAFAFRQIQGRKSGSTGTKPRLLTCGRAASTISILFLHLCTLLLFYVQQGCCGGSGIVVPRTTILYLPFLSVIVRDAVKNS